jgi:DNA-binding transcriptional ArsR family regulator
MQDVLYIDEVKRAAALLKPLRLKLLKRMAEPCSCPELAASLDETSQKVYYHVKVLEGAGLVEKVDERRVRGIIEGIYRAKARSYWLSPQVVGRMGGRRQAQDQMSLGFLLTLAEELQADVGHLAQEEKKTIHSLGLSAQIELRDAKERAAFLQELQEIFQALAHKYGSRGQDPRTESEDQSFRIVLACYPKPRPRDAEAAKGVKQNPEKGAGNE